MTNIINNISDKRKERRKHNSNLEIYRPRIIYYVIEKHEI